MSDSGSWYDHPAWFDLAFSDETADEAAFLDAVFHRFAAAPVRRVLEPACGTGRLIAALAKRGYEVQGFDQSGPMLHYAQQRLLRTRRPAELWLGRLEEFSLPRSVDAVFCTFNSFRHLLTEAAAISHLNCVTRALRPGGVYVLGLHLLPPDASDECTERWTSQRGRVRLTTTLRVIAANRRRRLETLRINMLKRTPRRTARLSGEMTLRTYSAGQLRRLLKRVPQLELVAVFDFWHEIDHPLALTDELADAVLVMRRVA